MVENTFLFTFFAGFSLSLSLSIWNGFSIRNKWALGRCVSFRGQLVGITIQFTLYWIAMSFAFYHVNCPIENMATAHCVNQNFDDSLDALQSYEETAELALSTLSIHNSLQVDMLFSCVPL